MSKISNPTRDAAGYLAAATPHGQMPGWATRHNDAWSRVLVPGESHSGALVAMLKGWYEYANAHQVRFGAVLGEDCVLGPVWQRMGEDMRELLNGETRNLDCGTVDGFILATMKAHGFTTLQSGEDL